MNQEIKAKWVSALRSGDYVQGTGQLRRSNKFCCLGVLCDLHAQEHPEIAAMQTDVHAYMGESGWPPNEVTNWASGNFSVLAPVSIGGDHMSLATHNDNGRTFLEIADAIESQL